MGTHTILVEVHGQGHSTRTSLELDLVASVCGQRAHANKNAVITFFCQSAQYSQHATYPYKGVNCNCFIYNNQLDTSPQLPGFNLYKFARGGHNGDGAGNGWNGPYNKDIYGTGMDGGTVQLNLGMCQTHCTLNPRCKAAQYSSSGNYHGNNCFIYDNQYANLPGIGNGFHMYYWKGNSALWSGAIYRDINGVGLGGSTEGSLDACKRRCSRNRLCQAAQFCSSCSYRNPTNGRTSNCFIYDNQYVNRPQLKQFILYKFNRKGCGTWGCCPDGVTAKISQWDACYGNQRLFTSEGGPDGELIEDPEGEMGNMVNVALPVLLSIGAVLAVVGVVRFTRARLSRRAIAVPTEEADVDPEGLVEDSPELYPQVNE